jgi:hypothetical protein
VSLDDQTSMTNGFHLTADGCLRYSTLSFDFFLFSYKKANDFDFDFGLAEVEGILILILTGWLELILTMMYLG